MNFIRNLVANGLSQFRQWKLPNGFKMLSVANLIKLIANVVDEFVFQPKLGVLNKMSYNRSHSFHRIASVKSIIIVYLKWLHCILKMCALESHVHLLCIVQYHFKKKNEYYFKRIDIFALCITFCEICCCNSPRTVGFGFFIWIECICAAMCVRLCMCMQVDKVNEEKKMRIYCF